MSDLGASEAYAAREQQRQWSDNSYEASGLMGYGRQLRRTKGGSFLNQAEYSGSSRTAVGEVPTATIMNSTTRATRYNGSGRSYARPPLPQYQQGDLKPDLSFVGKIVGSVGKALKKHPPKDPDK